MHIHQEIVQALKQRTPWGEHVQYVRVLGILIHLENGDHILIFGPGQVTEIELHCGCYCLRIMFHPLKA